VTEYAEPSSLLKTSSGATRKKTSGKQIKTGLGALRLKTSDLGHERALGVGRLLGGLPKARHVVANVTLQQIPQCPYCKPKTNTRRTPTSRPRSRATW